MTMKARLLGWADLRIGVDRAGRGAVGGATDSGVSGGRFVQSLSTITLHSISQHLLLKTVSGDHLR